MTKQTELVRYELGEELGECPITEREVIGRLMRLILDIQNSLDHNDPDSAATKIYYAKKNNWKEMGWSDLMEKDRNNKNDKDKLQSLVQWLIRYQENSLYKDFTMKAVIFDVYKEIMRIK